jgi:hypothetical protein
MCPMWVRSLHIFRVNVFKILTPRCLADGADVSEEPIASIPGVKPDDGVSEFLLPTTQSSMTKVKSST